MNAVLERVPFETCGFARALPFGIGGVTTAGESSVFSQKQKIESATSNVRTCHGYSRLRIGDKVIAITANGTTIPHLPAWANVLLENLPNRLGYFKGWDSYDAEPTKFEAVAAMFTSLFQVMQDSYAVPTVTALPDGGIQAEWHNGDEDLEIIFQAGQPGAFYYFDERTGEEGEGILATKIGEVRARIQRF